MKKKNKAMRLASVLLVLTLFTTSLTAGTFAKYTTGESGNDTARVAKFGVDVSLKAADVFGEEYNSDVKETPNDVSVKASTDVVAPGTKGSMTFSVTGVPETSVKLEFKLSGISEVMLAAGAYTNGTVSEILADNYYPVQWTLKKDSAPDAKATGTLKDIETYLKSLNQTYAPGALVNVAGEYELSWEWKFGDSNDSSDVADTILGDLAANDKDTDIQKDGSTLQVSDYNLSEAFTFSIKVTQAD